MTPARWLAPLLAIALPAAAEVLYHVDATGRLRGTWTANSGSADVEIGRSAYVLETGGALLANDSVLDDGGGGRVFAMLRYRRSNG